MVATRIGAVGLLLMGLGPARFGIWRVWGFAGVQGFE